MPLYQKLQGQSAAYFARHRTGNLLALLTADVEGVQDVVVHGTDSVLADALRLVIVAAILLWLRPLLLCACIVASSPMLAVGVLLVRFNRRVKPVYQASRTAVDALTATRHRGERILTSRSRPWNCATAYSRPCASSGRSATC